MNLFSNPVRPVLMEASSIIIQEIQLIVFSRVSAVFICHIDRIIYQALQLEPPFPAWLKKKNGNQGVKATHAFHLDVSASSFDFISFTIDGSTFTPLFAQVVWYQRHV